MRRPAMELVVTGCGVFGAAGTNCSELRDRLRNESLNHLAVQSHHLAVEPWVAGTMPEPNPDHAAELYFDKKLAKKVRRVTRHAGIGARAGVVAALEAWADADLALSSASDRVAVIVAGHNVTNDILLPAAEALRASGRLVNGRLMQVGHDAFLVSLLSEVLGIGGEGATVGGAQASGHIAMLHASRLLLSGDADLVLVVAAPTLLSPLEVAGYQTMGALAVGTDEVAALGCRPFDAAAAGFIPSETAAALVIETSEHAIRRRSRIQSRLHGWAGGMHRSTEPSPDQEAAIKVMRAAMEKAAIMEIDMVSAHATGTPLGDSVEAKALADVVGSDTWITAPKAVLGHGLTAAGILETIAAILQIRGGFLHGGPGLSQAIAPRLRHVPKGGLQQTVRHVLNNGFGFGGFNSALLCVHPDLGWSS